MYKKPSIIGLFTFLTFIILFFALVIINLILINMPFFYIFSILITSLAPCIIGNIYNLKYKESIDNKIKLQASICYAATIFVVVFVVLYLANSELNNLILPFSFFIIFSGIISYFSYNLKINFNFFLLPILMTITASYLFILTLNISNRLIMDMQFPFSVILATAISTQYNKKIIPVSSILFTSILFIIFYAFSAIKDSDIIWIIINFIIFWFASCFPLIKYTNLIFYINQNLGKVYEYRFKSKIKNSFILMSIIILFSVYIYLTHRLFLYSVVHIILTALYFLPLFAVPTLLKLIYKEIQTENNNEQLR